MTRELNMSQLLQDLKKNKAASPEHREIEDPKKRMIAEIPTIITKIFMDVQMDKLSRDAKSKQEWETLKKAIKKKIEDFKIEEETSRIGDAIDAIDDYFADVSDDDEE